MGSISLCGISSIQGDGRKRLRQDAMVRRRRKRNLLACASIAEEKGEEI